MAFTKGKSAKKVEKVPANYARKKAQEEAEEVEEVEVDEVEETQDEVQDDYEEEASAPAPRRGAQASHSAPRPQGGRPQSSGSGEGQALRLTGLFAGKREGCYTGRLRDEDADNLKHLIEQARSSGQQVVFFMWENQGNPQFSLTANISAPFKKSFGGQNRGGNRGGNFNRGFRRY